MKKSMAKQGVRWDYEDDRRTYGNTTSKGLTEKKAKNLDKMLELEAASKTPGGQAGIVGSLAALEKGKSPSKQDMKPVKTSSSKKPIKSDLKINNQDNIPSWAKEFKKNKQEAYDNRIRMRTDKAPTKQMAPIDPMTGMPIQPQMTPQPNTVGMPGSMQMPAGMGHNLPEYGIQAGGRRLSPAMQKKKITIPGGAISESGHVYDNHKGGIKEGDLIRGEHIKYGPEGLPMDFDYKVKFEKDTVDQHGPYKIYKTTGIK